MKAIDTKEYNLKIIECGDRIEIYKTNDYSVITKNNSNNAEGRKGKVDVSEETKEENKIRSKKTNLTDSRNKIVRLIKSNMDMKTFITLTFAEERDYKTSKKLLNNLFNKLRRDYKGLKYIWVLEYGDLNNRLHYHLLCNYPIEIKLSRSNKRKTKAHKDLENYFCSRYWSYGFVDIRQLEEEGNTNIALYVSAYIVKSLGDVNLEGYRIFGYSNKTLDKPLVSVYYTDKSTDKILKDFKDKYKINYNNSYPIGYIKDGKERKGTMNYFDMEVKKK